MLVISQNATMHLHEIFRRNTDFSTDFKNCLYGYDVGEEFELAWTNMIQKYGLQGNKWLHEKFETREKWALAYGGETFCADIANTQKNDNLSAAVKKYLNSKSELWHFFEAFEKLLDERRYKELQCDFEMSQSTPYLRVQWKLLKHAASLYTPAVFKVLEKEMVEILDLEILVNHVNGTSTEYRISDSDRHRMCTISFDDSNCNISCSCRMFESEGIFCRHVLKVLETRNVKNVPEQYIMKRWTKKAKEGVVGDNHGVVTDVDPKVQISVRYRNLCPMLVQLAMKASLSEDTSKMVSDFTVRMMKEIDNHLGSILLDNTQATQTAEVGRIMVENMEPIDCSSEDGESLIDEEDEGGNQGILVETTKRPGGTDDSVRNSDSHMIIQNFPFP